MCSSSNKDIWWYMNIWIFEWVYIYMVYIYGIYIWYIYGIDVCSTSLRCRHHFSIPSEFSSSALDLQSAGVRKPYTATGERSWCSIANCWMTQGYVETMRNTDHTDLKSWRIVWFHVVFCCFFPAACAYPTSNGMTFRGCCSSINHQRHATMFSVTAHPMNL